MNWLISAFSRFYRVLLSLLPRGFQRQFKAEMCLVFADAIYGASKNGVLALLSAFWREIWGMPGLLVAEYWSAITTQPGNEPASRHELNPVSSIEWSMDMEKTSQNGQWHFTKPRSLWVAALPPLIFGLGGGLAVLAAATRNLFVITAVWLLPVLLIAAGAAMALLKKFPDWGYSWMGSALMLTAVSLKLLAEELDETGRFIISATGDLVLMGIILLAGFVLLVLSTRRGWQMAGLVSICYAAIFGQSTLLILNNAPFNRADLVLLSLPIGAVLAAVVFFYIRGSDTGRVLLLAAVWAVNAGIFFIAHQVWQTWLTTRGGVSPLIPLLVFSTGFVLSGPVIGLVSKPFFRLLGRV